MAGTNRERPPLTALETSEWTLFPVRSRRGGNEPGTSVRRAASVRKISVALYHSPAFTNRERREPPRMRRHSTLAPAPTLPHPPRGHWLTRRDARCTLTAVKRPPFPSHFADPPPGGGGGGGGGGGDTPPLLAMLTPNCSPSRTVCCYRAAAPDSLAATTEHTGASSCVRHTARRRLWGVGAACEEAAGRRASPVRRYTTGGGPPPAQRRMCVRAFAGLRGCGAPHGATGVCGRGVTSGLTTVFQSQADGAVQGARGMRLDEARVRREVRLPSAARVRKKMPERRLHMGPPEPRVFRASGGSW